MELFLSTISLFLANWNEKAQKAEGIGIFSESRFYPEDVCAKSGIIRRVSLSGTHHNQKQNDSPRVVQSVLYTYSNPSSQYVDRLSNTLYNNKR